MWNVLFYVCGCIQAAAFLFNFGRTITLTKLHDCELSNSEGALKPHKMYSRRGFDYFGMESVVSFNRNRYIKAIPLVLFCYFFNQVNEIIKLLFILQFCYQASITFNFTELIDSENNCHSFQMLSSRL